MREHSRQENTAFCSPRMKNSAHEEIREVEEEPDQRQGHTRKDSALLCLTRYHTPLNEHSP